MPMGGIGERFKKFGYVNPKPLINIKKKPMFLLSSKSLPQSNSWIFVVPYKFKHIRVFQNNLKRYFKKYKIIYLKNKTSGQAITCLKAYKYNGFWHAIDTMRDKLYLESLISPDGKFPWIE